MSYYFTSESVTEGHPDKVCDRIADAILDEALRQDKDSRVAIEVMVTEGQAVIAGEVTTEGYFDVQRIARGVIKKIGYTKAECGFNNSCGILSSIHRQSPDIARGTNDEVGGAGDQGIMFGYACDETEELMPAAIALAHKLSARLTEVRKKGILDYLGPDGKTQVTIEYNDDGKPERIDTILVSAQHSKETEQETIRKDIYDKVIVPSVEEYNKHTKYPLTFDETTKIYVNPTGRFVVGGPAADTGVTNRKIIVDTYGGYGRHGGGGLSGKDPSKVDRSACYAARWAAKNVVAAGLATKCEIQLSYAIGMASPLSIYVDTKGTGVYPDEKIAQAVDNVFDFTPKGIINTLHLRRPIYEKTSNYGHFGRALPEFEWEKTDRVDLLKIAVRQ